MTPVPEMNDIGEILSQLISKIFLSFNPYVVPKNVQVHLFSIS